jgi:hypothetical protein
MKRFYQCIATQLLSIAAVCSLLAAIPVSAEEPDYVFKLTRDRQPELCAHMSTVFNQYFQHMWTTDVFWPATQDSIYSRSSKYAFPLLPGTPHVTRMTFDLRYSKVPSSPEFDAIQWHEGHTIFGGGGAPTDVSNSYVRPYLIAYFDIDNDGNLDTVVKVGSSKGYEWMFSRGEVDSLSEETLTTYRDTKIDQSAPTTLSELMFGSDKYGKPIVTSSGYLRPFIYKGKTYMANYSQGSYDAPTKQSRANVKNSIPPHEKMIITSYAYKGVVDPMGKPQWTEELSCLFDMVQNTINR